jgi:calcium-dependent protein kinase
LDKLKIKPGIFVQKYKADPFKDYELLEYLGEGGYGKVYKVRHLSTNQVRAMKIIKKKNPIDEKKILKEISLLKGLNHPNILKVYEFFTYENNIFIINEFCSGGELFDKLTEVKYFSEYVAANIMRQLLSAINFCHENGIIHRDLKPENILIESKNEKYIDYFKIKIIDFGTCELFQSKMLKEQIGTSFYIAPEVLKNNYNEKCDLWSCGVILYILLCGSPPFYGEDEDEIFTKILFWNYSFKQSIWEDISNEAKDLINKLLELNPKKRLSAKEALEHKWFKKFNIKKEQKNKIKEKNLIQILKNITEFRAEQKLQQATLAYLIHNLTTSEEIQDLKEVFMYFDTNHDGRLTKEEFLNGLTRISNGSFCCDSVDNIIKTIDGDNNGYIEFDEFLRATINKENLLTEKNLKMAFDFFDRDKNGGISAKELKYILKEGNINSKDSVWKNMIKEIDLNGDGQINFYEFKQMMKKVVMKKKEEDKNLKSIN